MDFLKIGILLGSPQISGGTYVIFEHGSRIKRRGHRVVIITKHDVVTEDYDWHPAVQELEWMTVEQAGTEQFDIIIATWWQSPFLLQKFKSSHYVYFVQSIETRFFQPPDPRDYASQDDDIWQYLCEQTYSYNIPIITEAEWIQSYLYNRYNNYPQLVRNGIRKDLYTTEGAAISPRPKRNLRVLVEGPVDVDYKNVSKSIQLAKQAGVHEIWLLTSSNISDYEDVDRVFSQVSIHETPAIYRSCDVLVKLSYVEGMFGPPLEMFHCGGTALVYSVTGHDEYIVHRYNSYVVDKDDEESVVRHLKHLKGNTHELDRLKNGALQTASEWPGWTESSKNFCEALQSISCRRPVNRQYLLNKHNELFETIVPRFKAQKIADSFKKRERAAWKGERTDKDNFVELYWTSKKEWEFDKNDSLSLYYQSEEWTTIRLETYVTAFPFWVRFDPSVRVGIIEFAHIIVRNKTREKEIMSFCDAHEFEVLFLTGDSKWIIDDKKNIVFSYGEDPVLILPAVKENCADVGDCLEIEVKLMETGIQQFFTGQQLSLDSNIESVEQDKLQAAPWWKRVLRSNTVT